MRRLTTTPTPNDTSFTTSQGPSSSLVDSTASKMRFCRELSRSVINLSNQITSLWLSDRFHLPQVTNYVLSFRSFINGVMQIWTYSEPPYLTPLSHWKGCFTYTLMHRSKNYFSHHPNLQTCKLYFQKKNSLNPVFFQLVLCSAIRLFNLIERQKW